MKKRKRKTSSETRLNKTRIAALAGCDRRTLAGYLARDDAPRPDRKGRFDVRETLKFLEENSPRAGEAPSVRALRARRLALEIAALEREDKIASRGLIPAAQIVPAVAKFNQQLTDDLVFKFEGELPRKYAGRSVPEIAKLNQEAVTWVLTRLKFGERAIMPDGGQRSEG